MSKDINTTRPFLAINRRYAETRDEIDILNTVKFILGSVLEEFDTVLIPETDDDVLHNGKTTTHYIDARHNMVVNPVSGYGTFIPVEERYLLADTRRGYYVKIKQSKTKYNIPAIGLYLTEAKSGDDTKPKWPSMIAMVCFENTVGYHVSYKTVVYSRQDIIDFLRPYIGDVD